MVGILALIVTVAAMGGGLAFKPIKEVLVTLRSRDIKIWMHLQNLGQLKERYGNWQDFMSSCDKQFFAVNDHGSAEEI